MCKRIIESLEKFSKISGLNKLKANNLQKKTEKGLINIRNEKQIHSNWCLKEEAITNGILESNFNPKEIYRPDKSFHINNAKDREELQNEICNVNTIKDISKKVEKIYVPPNQTISSNNNIISISNQINSSTCPFNGTNNLCNTYFNVKEEIKIGDYLNSKDIIFFELEFDEIWLEVEMTLTSDDNKSLIISFEIKVQVDEYITNLTKLLIKMGMKSWAKYILDIEPNPDFYLLTHFKYIESSLNNDYYHAPSGKFKFYDTSIQKQINNYNNASQQNKEKLSFRNINTNTNDLNCVEALVFENNKNSNNEKNLNKSENQKLEFLNKNFKIRNSNNFKILSENLNCEYLNKSGIDDDKIEEEMQDFQGKI